MLLLVAEFILIFILLPILIWATWEPGALVIIPLYMAAGIALWWLVVKKKISLKQIWVGDSRDNDYRIYQAIFYRFIAVVVLCLLVVYVFFPEKLFEFPMQHPLLWLMVIILYPVFSVLPQEILYRTFFFNRYDLLFKSRLKMVLVNAFVFMHMHLVFESYFVLLATFIGGYFFASTFFRTMSLKLVFLEHSLYGFVIFTVGLVELFFLAFKF
jgi:membrane protease YdiL (CAAX protease family)